jgi:heme/copper-type cytochrome/quinol oxidase subunit 2
MYTLEQLGKVVVVSPSNFARWIMTEKETKTRYRYLKTASQTNLKN